MSRIGIFGGSFDPIHNGHIGVAERAMSEYSLDKVMVIPAKVSPFKLKACPQLDDAMRWRMVVAACAGHPGLEPCDVELKRGGVSYAIDTVAAIREMHPEDELFFILGEDSVKGLPQWKDYDRLRTLCKFVSFPRTRESSTEIRQRIERGEPFDDMVPPAVAEMLRTTRVQHQDGAPPRALADSSISALVPHKPPMILIDDVESFDAEDHSLTAKVTITRDSPFFEDGGVPSWAAIEYMAQTIAALVGKHDRMNDPEARPRPGFLLGTRRLTLDLDCFECGRTYHIQAKEEYSDAGAAAFDCRILDDVGTVLATAIINAYRPENMEDFTDMQRSRD